MELPRSPRFLLFYLACIVIGACLTFANLLRDDLDQLAIQLAEATSDATDAAADSMLFAPSVGNVIGNIAERWPKDSETMSSAEVLRWARDHYNPEWSTEARSDSAKLHALLPAARFAAWSDFLNAFSQSLGREAVLWDSSRTRRTDDAQREFAEAARVATLAETRLWSVYSDSLHLVRRERELLEVMGHEQIRTYRMTIYGASGAVLVCCGVLLSLGFRKLPWRRRRHQYDVTKQGAIEYPNGEPMLFLILVCVGITGAAFAQWRMERGGFLAIAPNMLAVSDSFRIFASHDSAFDTNMAAVQEAQEAALNAVSSGMTPRRLNSGTLEALELTDKHLEYLERLAAAIQFGPSRAFVEARRELLQRQKDELIACQRSLAECERARRATRIAVGADESAQAANMRATLIRLATLSQKTALLTNMVHRRNSVSRISLLTGLATAAATLVLVVAYTRQRLRRNHVSGADAGTP